MGTISWSFTIMPGVFWFDRTFHKDESGWSLSIVAFGIDFYFTRNWSAT